MNHVALRQEPLALPSPSSSPRPLPANTTAEARARGTPELLLEPESEPRLVRCTNTPTVAFTLNQYTAVISSVVGWELFRRYVRG